MYHPHLEYPCKHWSGGALTKDPLSALLISILNISSKIFIVQIISAERICMDLPLEENQGRLSYWLFYTHRCVSYAYADVLRAHCEERGKPYVITPPQWGALSLLLAQDGQTIGTMAHKRGVDAPTATGIITRLEQHGLLERRHERDDRRVVKI